MATADSKRVVREYFAAVAAGDPEVARFLDDDVTWWVPPGSPMGGTYRGKAAVLELMGAGRDVYDPATPFVIELESLLAEDDRVAAEVVLNARTAAGETYRNHYHFAFRVRDGRLVEVREHLDTRLAQEKLFDPVAGARRTSS